MNIISDPIAKEEAAFVIQCVFEDEDGNSITPSTLTWTLTDTNGSVINSRADVNVSSPASTTNIVISGNDLAILGGETSEEIERILTLKGTYNSSYGSGLPLRDDVLFYIENLTVIT